MGLKLRSAVGVVIVAGLLSHLPTSFGSDWRTVYLPTRPLNIAANNGALWACGADESIFRSTDGGQTWTNTHVANNGGLLLNIGFANDRLGYATGTGGSILLTNDGGTSWRRVAAPSEVIYQASFSDEKHGIIHAARNIYTTADGGTSWSAVKLDFGSEELKGFSYVSTVLALDAEHMAIVLSLGNATYFAPKLLFTKDGAATWKTSDIPSVGLTILTTHRGEYWFAGMEVIEKDKPGGGHGVPLVMHSPDGESWTHLARWTDKEFSGCTSQGCLYWDGAGVEIPPSEPVAYWTFGGEKAVTAKWAIGNGSICSLATYLKCAPVSTSSIMPSRSDSSSSIEQRLLPPALNAAVNQGVQCIFCDVPRIIVTRDYTGPVEVELKIRIGTNGLVEQVEVVHETRNFGEAVASTAHNWIFVPFEKDGTIRPVITNMKVRTQAIKGK